jgi:hypothetical protein
MATPSRTCTIFGVPDVAGAACVTIDAGFQFHAVGYWPSWQKLDEYCVAGE